MNDVRAICAIGLRGQLGLHGRMPWEGDADRWFEPAWLVAGAAPPNTP